MKESPIKRTFLYGLALLTILSASASGQIRGLPASDQLGAEDGNGNPTFVGGVTDGGPTAHSEW
jgi:hypothetical protein